MSETIKNRFGGHLVIDPSGDGFREINGGSTGIFTLPQSDADWVSFLSDLTGRKIAAIVYEGELPEVADHGTHLLIEGRSSWPINLAQRTDFRQDALASLAYARALEARDAAAKEVKRAGEREIDALHTQLVNEIRQPLLPAFTRRAYELGARADAAQGDGASS